MYLGSAAEQLWAALAARPAAAQAGADWLSGPDPLRGTSVEVLLEGALRWPLRLQVRSPCAVFTTSVVGNRRLLRGAVLPKTY